MRGFVLTIRDVTERKHLEDEILLQSLHDPLTGLANRALFTDRLEHAVARVARTEESFALLYLDLDAFKPISDTYGRRAGDAVLVDVAIRLQEASGRGRHRGANGRRKVRSTRRGRDRSGSAAWSGGSP